LSVVTVHSSIVTKMTLSPASRLADLESRLSAVQARSVGPCGGFTAAYRCACDYHGIQFVDEIAWVGSTMVFSTAELCIAVGIFVAKERTQTIGNYIRGSFKKFVDRHS